MSKLKKTEDKIYYQTSKTFIECEQLINNDTGEIYKPTPADKLVFMRLRDQYVYRANKNQQYFESAKMVGSYIGVSESTAKRSIKQLKQLGIILVNGKKSRANAMTINDPVSLSHLKLINTSISEAVEEQQTNYNNYKEEKDQSEKKVNTYPNKMLQDKKANLWGKDSDKYKAFSKLVWKATNEGRLFTNQEVGAFMKDWHEKHTSAEQPHVEKKPVNKFGKFRPTVFSHGDDKVGTKRSTLGGDQTVVEQEQPSKVGLTQKEMMTYLSDVHHVPFDSVSEHKDRLQEIHLTGAMVNAIFDGYGYGDKYYPADSYTACAAIHALYETGLYEELDSSAALDEAVARVKQYEEPEDTIEEAPLINVPLCNICGSPLEDGFCNVDGCDNNFDNMPF